MVALGAVGWLWWRAAKVPLVAAQPRTVPPTVSQPRTGPAAPPVVLRVAVADIVQTNLSPASNAPAPPLAETNRPVAARRETNAPPAAPIELPSPPPKTNALPASPESFPRPVKDLGEAQIALARRGISPGSLDGRNGPQTRGALSAFQRQEHLAVTGELDDLTREHLLLETPPYGTYTISSSDLSRLQPLSRTWLGKSQQSALEYETILELIAEKGEAHPNLVKQLNPGLDWKHVVAGVTVQLPQVACSEPAEKAACIRIKLGERMLEAFNAESNLVAHFPCSIAQRVEKRPAGELHVAVIVPHPNYTFDPALFPESAEAKELKSKLVLPPGPNNPVGLAWIGLDKAGYGIHGTPNPEQVGRTESHGCFRLANWNAERLLRMVWIGMPVYVEK